jgi:hypothetical protein
MAGLTALLGRVEALLAPIDGDELARTRNEVDASIARLEAIGAELAAIARAQARVRLGAERRSCDAADRSVGGAASRSAVPATSVLPRRGRGEQRAPRRATASAACARVRAAPGPRA